MEGVSVIICCFNSSNRLHPTLLHLYRQKNISNSQWEIILVDNASTDDTSKKAREIWDEFVSEKPPFKVVFESKAGLSAARSRGIQESKFSYILFCDDDNWLYEEYVSNALNIMNSSPAIGILGGYGVPVFETKEPPYFWENQYHVLAVGEQWHDQGDITEQRGVVYGAGMVLNRSAYNVLIEKFNFEFQVSDRIGNSLVSSGDHELCLALKRLGYKIFYSKGLLFKHYIPEKRTTITYYKNLFLSFGMSDARLFVYSINEKNFSSIKNDYRYICLRCGRNILTNWIRLLFSGYYLTSDKYKYISNIHHLYSNIGILKTMWLLKNSYKNILRENALFRIENKKSFL